MIVRLALQITQVTSKRQPDPETTSDHDAASRLTLRTLRHACGRLAVRVWPVGLEGLPCMPSIHQQALIELPDLSGMDRIRRLFRSQQPYEPIDGHRDGTAISGDGSEDAPEPEENPFSQVEYWTFLLMGVAMLWAWNMFLAAAPYFQYRFSSDQRILAHFQSAETSIATVTNLGSMLILTKLQKNASYPYRIASSLCINIICFTFLALSTLVTTSTGLYFGFLMLMVFGANFATGLIQNGVFAYVSGFGRSEYTQAIMTGQAVAGVLPCLAQIGAVLAVPERNQQSPNQAPTESPTSAFAYFLTATAISVIALLAFLYLLRRRRNTALSPNTQPPATKPITNGPSAGHNPTPIINNTSPSPSLEERKPEPNPKPAIPLTRLLRLLPTLSATVFLTFAITMISPVFTIRIHSVNPHLLPSALFIPLAFLFWNVGDLLGRILTLAPSLRLTHRPPLLLALALLRLIFIPLYLLCNISGASGGPKVKSDVFYLGVVQLWFGISNGYLGSSCMMGAGEWVAEEEREAAGGWMGLCLVAGLTVGSLLSFSVGSA